MEAFEIKGGAPLSGSIVPQGAKNEALQILCAVLLTGETVEISNIPDIRDVNLLIDLLGDLGVEVNRVSRDTCIFKAANVDIDFLQSAAFKEKSRRLRGSVMILGPLLARFKKASLPKPGGDKIGRRRLDTHFLGFEKLGARFNYDTEDAFYTIDASHLQGTYILLDEASVTGTANIVMAAVLAKGTTTIYNAACEPYLQQLCRMLVRMGAKIGGIGSNLLTIEGVDQLGGTTHRMLPDMIEIGSFIGLAAMTSSELTIKDVAYDQLGLIPDVFGKLGIQMERRGDDLFIPAQAHYEIQTFIDGSIMTIADAPWPGFTPDLLSIILVVATQARGSVLVHQKMFESRLFFVDKLIDMGRGLEMSSPDIRAGVSLLIAALSANGTSIIRNIEQIDRGYQQIDTRLQALGANIQRISAT
jgi:UDP-N-acetylglucosamine 1-carboxyvinyltransferase